MAPQRSRVPSRSRPAPEVPPMPVGAEPRPPQEPKEPASDGHSSLWTWLVKPKDGKPKQQALPISEKASTPPAPAPAAIPITQKPWPGGQQRASIESVTFDTASQSSVHMGSELHVPSMTEFMASNSFLHTRLLEQNILDVHDETAPNEEEEHHHHPRAEADPKEPDLPVQQQQQPPAASNAMPMTTSQLPSPSVNATIVATGQWELGAEKANPKGSTIETATLMTNIIKHPHPLMSPIQLSEMNNKPQANNAQMGGASSSDNLDLIEAQELPVLSPSKSTPELMTLRQVESKLSEMAFFNCAQCGNRLTSSAYRTDSHGQKVCRRECMRVGIAKSVAL